MPRQLSEIEKRYIREHYLEETAAQIALKIDGIGEKTVQNFIDTLPPPNDSSDTFAERQRKLQSTSTRVGDLMGRDRNRGVTVMTEGASELSDARSVVAVPPPSEERKRKMKGIIHRPFEEVPYDR